MQNVADGDEENENVELVSPLISDNLRLPLRENDKSRETGSETDLRISPCSVLQRKKEQKKGMCQKSIWQKRIWQKEHVPKEHVPKENLAKENLAKVNFTKVPQGRCLKSDIPSRMSQLAQRPRW